MIRVFVALFLALFTMDATAVAHGVPTHVNITNAAVDYLQQLALTRVEGVDQRFACKTDLKQQLIGGVRLEDDLNLDRAIRHFNPSLTAAVADCNSTHWGFKIRNCTGLGRTLTNWHQWRDAINAANSAGDGWSELGWVIHLLQDLTSPAHTRDDAHLIIPIGNRLFMDVDGDPLEMKERIPSIPPLEPLMKIANVEDFFEAIQSNVQRSYFSAGSVFEAPGIDVSETSEDFSYYYYQGEPIAHKDWRYYVFFAANGYFDPRLATVDETIAARQWDRLGPLAVRITASLIAHYLVEAEAASGEELLPPCDLLGHYEGVVKYTSTQFTGANGVCLQYLREYAVTLKFVYPFPDRNFGYWNLDLIGTATLLNCAGQYVAGPFSEHRGDSPKPTPNIYGGIVYGIPISGSVHADSCYFGTLPTSRCWSVWVKFDIDPLEANGVWDFYGNFFGTNPGSYDEVVPLKLSRVRR
jgi:hypothetical protein